MLMDKNNAFFAELVKYHVSGQLKVAPEHCIDGVLDYMGKPHIDVYERFQQKYRSMNQRFDKNQFLVPYLMSSHPGSRLEDAVALAEYLKRTGRRPEQVQDFYPTPGTMSTCMYYTEIDPRTMKRVYVAKTQHEKDMQRALLQFHRPEKRRLVMEALREAGREDLIGWGKDCLVRPAGEAPWQREKREKEERTRKGKKNAPSCGRNDARRSGGKQDPRQGKRPARQDPRGTAKGRGKPGGKKRRP